MRYENQEKTSGPLSLIAQEKPGPPKTPTDLPPANPIGVWQRDEEIRWAPASGPSRRWRAGRPACAGRRTGAVLGAGPRTKGPRTKGSGRCLLILSGCEARKVASQRRRVPKVRLSSEPRQRNIRFPPYRACELQFPRQVHRTRSQILVSSAQSVEPLGKLAPPGGILHVPGVRAFQARIEPQVGMFFGERASPPTRSQGPTAGQAFQSLAFLLGLISRQLDLIAA